MLKPDFLENKQKNCSSIVGITTYWTPFMLEFPWLKAHGMFTSIWTLVLLCSVVARTWKHYQKKTRKHKSQQVDIALAHIQQRKWKTKQENLMSCQMWNGLYKQWKNTAKVLHPVQFSGAWWQDDESDAVTPSPTRLHDKLPFNKMCIPYESAYVNAWCTV